MRVKAKQAVEVEISEGEMRDVALTYLRTTFDIGSNDYIDNEGQLVWDDWYRSNVYTTHVRRKATDTDKAAVAAINLISKGK